jgi:hypothetical protein
MGAIYQLRLYSPAGVLRAIITDYQALSYHKALNEPGVCQFVLNAEHAAIEQMEMDAQVEVWRQDIGNGVDWYPDFYGLWRGEERAANSDGTSYYTAICPGQLSLLDRSIVAYKAAVTNRSRFSAQPAETILKNLVTYNATASGTTGDGRARTVTTVGVSVQATGGAGNTLTYECAFRNLLTSLQEVASIGGGDFDLVKTGAQAWEFRWYAGQRGTDRSATVTFALQYGNMANPKLVRNSVAERTVAIVGGSGEETARTLVTRTGTNYNASANACETFVDARNSATTALLNAEGDRALEAGRSRDALTFDVLQVPSTLYGLHYGLGDRITGFYQGVTATKVIRRVTVSVDGAGQDSIKVELRDV